MAVTFTAPRMPAASSSTCPQRSGSAFHASRITRPWSPWIITLESSSESWQTEDSMSPLSAPRASPGPPSSVFSSQCAGTPVAASTERTPS